MSEENSWDNLKDLTKQEIIDFLKTQFHYRLPSKREVKSFKWSKDAAKLQIEMDDHLSNPVDPDLIKKRDEYARSFNASKDTSERVRLLDKINPIDDLISRNHEKYKAIARKQQKNDKYYNSFNQ
jgi:hypothetical protein